MDDARKPIVVAVVIAVVMVVLFVLGVGLGGRDDGGGGSEGWQERLSGIGGGAQLEPEDLRVSKGSCEVASTSVTVRGTCVLVVAESGGFLGLGTPTRRAHLENQSAQAVRLVLVVEGQSIKTSLEAHKDDDADDAGDDETDLTFGRSGGSFTIECAPGSLVPQDCVLTLD